MIKEILYKRRCMSKELGKRINEAIEGSQFTKAEVARAFGITPQAVNGWVTTGRISKELLVELASLIGANPNYLLFGYETESDEVGIGDKEVALFLDDDQHELLKLVAKKYGVSEEEAAQIAMKKGIKNFSNRREKGKSQSEDYATKGLSHSAAELVSLIQKLDKHQSIPDPVYKSLRVIIESGFSPKTVAAPNEAMQKGLDSQIRD